MWKMTNIELNENLESLKNELKILIAKYYGDASYDEIIKLSAFNNLQKLTFRNKLSLQNHLTNLRFKANITANDLDTTKEIDETKEPRIREYIDRALTFTYLNSLKPNIFLSYGSYTEILEDIFNHILCTDYNKYLAAYMDLKLLKQKVKNLAEIIILNLLMFMLISLLY